MIRKRKQYKRPRQLFESERIKEENALKKKYGLRNKTEIWKTLAKVNYYRHRAKALARETLEKQEQFFNKLKALGLKVENISDVLDLKVEDLLERRLPTIVAKKKLAPSPLTARQMVTHKRVLIDGKAVSSPSYIVPVEKENAITIKKKEKKAKPKPAEESNPEVPIQETDAPAVPQENSDNQTGGAADNKEETK